MSTHPVFVPGYLLALTANKIAPANKPKFHQPAPHIQRTTGRDKPVVGRAICLVGAAEQSACYGIKNATQESVIYDTDIYWKQGGGSRKVSQMLEMCH